MISKKSIVLLTAFLNLITILKPTLAAESEVYYDNEVHTCKSDEYFDVDYLKCKKCEVELNLVPLKDSKYKVDYLSISYN